MIPGSYMPQYEERHPDPARYARVEAMAAAGVPDRRIVKELAVELEVHENTIRRDLARLWRELADQREVDKTYRRDVMRYRLEGLRAETYEVGKKARDGFTVLDREGMPVEVQDLKVAAMAFKTCGELDDRLIRLDGLSESDKVKLDILRDKMRGGLSESELERLIREETRRMVASMSDEEIAALRRKGDAE